jgi:hypothetical protein
LRSDDMVVVFKRMWHVGDKTWMRMKFLAR